MKLDEIIARCEADASTEDRKMILALAKHVRGDKPDQGKAGDQKGGQKSGGETGGDAEGNQE